MAKIQFCDGCHKERKNVISCGRDSNGDPDAPDLCFICRKEAEKFRCWSHKAGKYIPNTWVYTFNEVTDSVVY
jgi:hypothetical protein